MPHGYSQVTLSGDGNEHWFMDYQNQWIYIDEKGNWHWPGEKQYKAPPRSKTHPEEDD